MIARFERRFALVSAVVIGGGFAAIVIGFALFAFSLDVGALQRDQQDAVADARSALIDDGPLPSDARVAAELLTERFFNPQLRILVFDNRERVEISRRSSVASSPYIVSTTPRNDVPATYATPGSLGTRATLALATLFGLHPSRAIIGPLLIVVRADGATLMADAQRVLPMLAAALVVAIGLGIAFGRLLVREAVRPLREASAERDSAYAAMRQFTSDAGHQLRTPLTVVRGFIGVLLRGDLREPSDRDRILTTMNQQCALMGSLIEKLMLLETWDTSAHAPAEPIDLSQLVEDVVTPIAESAPTREVRLCITPGVLARIDPSDGAHALANLLDNALKYAPEGPIDVSLAADERRVRIAVADHGPGMSPDEERHAFDRFFRGPLHRAVAGSGLGLAIARRAIERANGTLDLETAPGRGSRFTIELPRGA